MKRHLELASHGHLASGALSALKILVGNKNNISAMDCYVDNSFDLQKAVEKVISDHKEEDLILVTDLFGGSVNNEFMQYLTDNIFLIAGMNLPFLLELAVNLDSPVPTKEIIQNALNASAKSLKFCNAIDLSETLQDENF